MLRQCKTCKCEFDAKTKRNRYCSKKCKQERYELTCQKCGDTFRAYLIRPYCSKSCSTSIRNQNHNMYDDWVKKYGPEIAEQKLIAFKKKLSEKFSGERNPMFGDHEHTKGWRTRSANMRGKTLEELYGPDRAIDIRRRQSDAMTGVKNPAYGKIYMNGGKSLKGYYKGKFFRSLLEYSFLKHLESQGVDLDSDVVYEGVLIKYEFNECERTYRPDFYVKSQHTMYEVKPSYAICQELNCAKFEAAREFFQVQGDQFKVVTEQDFIKIELVDAIQDQDVVWNEKTFLYFKDTLGLCQN